MVNCFYFFLYYVILPKNFHILNALLNLSKKNKIFNFSFQKKNKVFFFEIKFSFDKNNKPEFL